jgi:alpha-D-xyloside xylohydrolase
VLNIGDQYLFGPAIMVTPITSAGSTTRSIYLPADRGPWHDFWTGVTNAAGQSIEAAAPVETLPLFVRPGSIIPLGPLLQYSSEKLADPVEIRIYRGADGQFTLYEDEGDNYHYEKGEYATIPISWHETRQTLEIGKRTGKFSGMLKERTFNIVWVSENHGAGISATEKPDAVVHYTGRASTVIGPH